MATILTVENQFKEQDAAVRKKEFNKHLARIISWQENALIPVNNQHESKTA